MRRPGLFETQFHIPVELPLVLYGFQPATGLVVTRLELITTISKKIVFLNSFFDEP